MSTLLVKTLKTSFLANFYKTFNVCLNKVSILYHFGSNCRSTINYVNFGASSKHSRVVTPFILKSVAGFYINTLLLAVCRLKLQVFSSVDMPYAMAYVTITCSPNDSCISSFLHGCLSNKCLCHFSHFLFSLLTKLH